MFCFWKIVKFDNSCIEKQKTNIETNIIFDKMDHKNDVDQNKNNNSPKIKRTEMYMSKFNI